MKNLVSIGFTCGATVLIACLDNTPESYGFHTLRNVLKITLSLAGLVASVYAFRLGGIHLGTEECCIFPKIRHISANEQSNKITFTLPTGLESFFNPMFL